MLSSPRKGKALLFPPKRPPLNKYVHLLHPRHVYIYCPTFLSHILIDSFIQYYPPRPFVLFLNVARYRGSLFHSVHHIRSQHILDALCHHRAFMFGTIRRTTTRDMERVRGGSATGRNNNNTYEPWGNKSALPCRGCTATFLEPQKKVVRPPWKSSFK